MLITIQVNAQVLFPLSISSDKRYLVDQHQKPFPILGRTAWFIISQSEKGIREFIDNTISHGFNAIEMSVITHWPMGNHAPFNGEGQIPFLKRLNGEDWNGLLTYDTALKGRDMPDLQTPNQAYWNYVDKLLEYCEGKEIAVLLFPAYVGYVGQEQGWMKELVANGDEKVEAYGKWIATRYKDRKNIIWMLLGDMGKFNGEQKNAEQALINGLKSIKGSSIQYTAESHSGENAADNIHFGKEMTLNGVYTWSLDIPVPFLARKGYSHQPTMPAFLLEEPYDEEGPDGNNYNPNATQPVRRFQWWGWLNTIGGYVAGNGYVWQFVDPIWQQHLNTQGALDMKRLNSFIQSIEWWKLIPSGLGNMKHLVLDAGDDTSTMYVGSAAASDGTLLIAYLPPDRSGSFHVDMTALNKKAYGYWFDPTNGSYLEINGSPLSNRKVYEFIPPGKNAQNEMDWVLLLTTKKRK